jgi:hypothetical protein
MVKSDVGDEHIFSTLLKIHFDTGMVKFLGHRAKSLYIFLQCRVFGQQCIYCAIGFYRDIEKKEKGVHSCPLSSIHSRKKG